MTHPTAARKGRRPHFFKVFFADCSSKRLAIPAGFCNHIEPDIHRRICLRGPSGNAWSVDLVRDGCGSVFFQSGWEEFVSDHDLNTGDFLVFQYDGGRGFTVLVFDPTACEKEESFHVIPRAEVVILGESHKRRRRSEKEGVIVDAEIVETAPPVKLAPAKFNSSCRGCFSNQPCADCGGSGRGDLGVFSSKLSDRLMLPVRIKSRLGSVISRRRSITEEEKARTLELAMSFRSKRPFGISVMRDSNVYHGYYMGLPSSLVKHLPRASRTIRLRGPFEEVWAVVYIHYEGRGGFSTGWGKFASTHNLESDDVLVFELSRPLEVRVHIYRVVEQVSHAYH
ncbi:unnamed protein product [Spirodela intermedia]|uniref:TF-B3 domain-containing protein n=1 Tax=Spirodela intermedia TaxID=51605 RepID=A0A7I8KUG1_SPIIN|nr:unnamed protein product [Spirodela intermedia]